MQHQRKLLAVIGPVASRGSCALGLRKVRVTRNIRALQQVLPRLETRGFHFVPISQLLP